MEVGIRMLNFKCIFGGRMHYSSLTIWNISLQLLCFNSCKVFKTSYFEAPPEGYENVTNIVPPYNAFSAQGTPEVKDLFCSTL